MTKAEGLTFFGNRLWLASETVASRATLCPSGTKSTESAQALRCTGRPTSIEVFFHFENVAPKTK